MKIPPRWVFKIWASHRREILRTLPSDCKELDKLIKQVGDDYGAGTRPEFIVGYAWALYIDTRGHHHDETIINWDTKFAFTSFLKAGGGYIEKASQDFEKKYNGPLAQHDAMRWVIEAFHLPITHG